MNNDLISQLYMMMSLSHLNTGNDNTNFKNYLPIIIVLIPFLIKIYNWIIEYIDDLIHYNDNEKIVSIKFPVHEIKIHNNSIGNKLSTKHIYSKNYIAINDYIKDNLDKIDGISNLIEIMNVYVEDYYEYTDQQNYILLPINTSEVMIDNNNKIQCKIQLSDFKLNNYNYNQNDNKESAINNKNKTYELILFIKLDIINNNEKKKAMIKLNKFIDNCVKKYNEKNNDKYEGKHLIYEYYQSFKQNNSSLQLNFKEYLFENNKDIETNIFFEGKNELIKYVDKFIFNEEDVKKKITNKFEEEYKSFGYTYKASFLFYGFPGCGKTSTIKAILNRTKRHGIIINWSKIKTCEELETIFRNRVINDREYDSRELCFIIEDCDASANNILLSRKKNDIDDNSDNSFDLIDDDSENDNNNNDNNIDDNNDDIDENNCNNKNDNDNYNYNNTHNIKINKKNKTNNKLGSIVKILKKIDKSSTKIDMKFNKLNDDALNLACLLNILDGIIELYGVMVIFTTNRPTDLEDAFKRAGRIDFKQEFKRANISTIKSIVNGKFKLDSDFKFPIEKFNDYVLSPAEIQSICFKNDNIYNCIDELILEHNNNLGRIKLVNNK